MVSRRTDRLFHMMTHHTNKEQPYNQNISGEIFPAQDSDKLGRTITLKYKNRYIPNVEIDPELGSEIPVYNNDDPYSNIYEGEFIIVRCDLTEPNTIIFLSVDYSIMLVGDSRNYQEEINPDIVYKYPKQIEEYLGLYLNNQYYDTPEVRTRAVVVACDSTEPCNSIIAEFYKDNTVRFLLETEVQSIVMERYDPDGSRDYDGADPDDTLERIDIDGGSFVLFDTTFIDVNGGFPDPLQDMFKKDILTLEEVCRLRGKIIEERTIFGSEAIIPREVELNITSATLYRGEEPLILKAKLKPDVSISNIVWRSSDESLAIVEEIPLDDPDPEVDSMAQVTVVGSGPAKIYAIATDVWGRCVIDARVYIDTITIDQPSVNMIIGDEIQLNTTILPADATNKKLVWHTSDTSVVTVRQGKLKAIGEGSATITCNAVEGSATATCTVNVQTTYVPVSSVRITNVSGSPKRIDLSTNEPNVPKEYEVEVEVLPVDATDKLIYARVINPYDDFAVAIENITETKFKIKALCYCCEHLNRIEVYSHDNPIIKDTMEVYVNTKLEDVSLSDYEIELAPYIPGQGASDYKFLYLLFSPVNDSIYPNIIKAGANKYEEIAVSNTHYHSARVSSIAYQVDGSASKYKYIRYTISASAQRIGTDIIRFTKPDGTIIQCNIIVGEQSINSIKILDVPEVWDNIHIGDSFEVTLDIDPYYWYYYQGAYSVSWGIEGTGATLLNKTTSAVITITGPCNNTKITAYTNNGLQDSFIININS